MNRRIALLVSSLSLVAGFLAWRLYEARHSPPPPYIGIVRDSSDSDAVSCKAVRSLVMNAAVLPGIARGSKVALITTGDKHNNFEGKLVGVFEIPFSSRVIEGRAATSRRQQQLGYAVQQACEAAPTLGQSPILSAVKSGIDHLRANGCGKNSPCVLFVVTDGAETVDALLRSALKGSRASLGKLRGTVANDGIKVNFCGFAQTRLVSASHRAPQQDATADRLKEVWTALFSAPALVSTAPYCPD